MAPRPSYFVSTYDGASDLAGQMSAAFTSTALLFQNSDPAYYNQLMNASSLLYAAGGGSPGLHQGCAAVGPAPRLHITLAGELFILVLCGSGALVGGPLRFLSLVLATATATQLQTLRFLSLALAAATAAQLQAAGSGRQADPVVCAGPHRASLVSTLGHTCTPCTVARQQQRWAARGTFRIRAHVAHDRAHWHAVHGHSLCSFLQARAQLVTLHLRYDPVLHLHAEAGWCL